MPSRPLIKMRGMDYVWMLGLIEEQGCVYGGTGCRRESNDHSTQMSLDVLTVIHSRSSMPPSLRGDCRRDDFGSP